MGNTLCGSVVVIAVPNVHTQDDATDRCRGLIIVLTSFTRTASSLTLISHTV